MVESQWWLGSRYVPERHLGGGASGDVWLVRARHDGEEFAAKVLRPELAGDHVLRSRFLQEGLQLRGICHANLVRIHDLVAEGPTLAIVMDLVPGPSLRELLAVQGTLAPAQATAIAADVAAGLGALHEAGVLHRDVKPDNVLLEEQPQGWLARLADLGVAQLSVRADLTGDAAPGTPAYFAPEIRQGRPATTASDVHALGLLLAECLVGRRLTCDEQERAGRGKAPPTVLEAVPSQLAAELARCLRSSPRRRPPAAAVARRLRDLAQELTGVPALPPARVAEVERVLQGSSGTGETHSPPHGSGRRRAGVLSGRRRQSFAAVGAFCAALSGGLWLDGLQASSADRAPGASSAQASAADGREHVSGSATATGRPASETTAEAEEHSTVGPLPAEGPTATGAAVTPGREPSAGTGLAPVPVPGGSSAPAPDGEAGHGAGGRPLPSTGTPSSTGTQAVQELTGPGRTRPARKEGTATRSPSPAAPSGGAEHARPHTGTTGTTTTAPPPAPPPAPAPAPAPVEVTATITTPADGAAVARKVDVSGTAALPAGRQLWLLLRPGDGVYYTTTERPIRMSPTGAWTVSVTVGRGPQDVGRSFELSLVVAPDGGAVQTAVDGRPADQFSARLNAVPDDSTVLSTLRLQLASA